MYASPLTKNARCKKNPNAAGDVTMVPMAWHSGLRLQNGGLIGQKLGINMFTCLQQARHLLLIIRMISYTSLTSHQQS